MPRGRSFWVGSLTLIREDGFDIATGQVTSDDDSFWVADLAIGYRFPKRFGLATVEVRNLFDQDFHFQDTDPSNSALVRERAMFARLTLSFLMRLGGTMQRIRAGSLLDDEARRTAQNGGQL